MGVVLGEQTGAVDRVHVNDTVVEAESGLLDAVGHGQPHPIPHNSIVITTLDQAAELIDWYRCRWEIETLFHVLKNGCRVESLQLGDVKKLELALALYLVVAWRLAHLVRLGRVHPEWPASAVFDQMEWQAAWLMAEKDPPKKTPTVREVIRRIAMLGGFLARKGDGEPGVKTLWQGYARVTSFVRGVEKMRANHAR